MVIAPGQLLLDPERSLVRQLDDTDAAGLRDSLHLGLQGSGTPPRDIGHMFEELATRDPVGKLSVGEEVILASLRLPVSPVARGRRDSNLS